MSIVLAILAVYAVPFVTCLFTAIALVAAGSREDQRRHPEERR